MLLSAGRFISDLELAFRLAPASYCALAVDSAVAGRVVMDQPQVPKAYAIFKRSSQSSRSFRCRRSRYIHAMLGVLFAMDLLLTWKLLSAE